MPRPRYRITKADFQTAKAYLIRKGYERHPGSGVQPITHPDKLQEWCDDYLPPTVWNQLRATILQERKRGNDLLNNKTLANISVSRGKTLAELHKIQKKLADSGHKVTIDQLIYLLALKYSDQSALVIMRELDAEGELAWW